MIQPVEIQTYKRCVCGGLIVSMWVGGVAVEACERGGTASVCAMPRVEYSHNHFPEPQQPILTRPFVLSTATATNITPPTGQLYATSPV